MHEIFHSEENTTPGRGRRVQGDERRRALILAAYQLIAEKGFEQLRTRDIAQRVGVNIATLHYYFASKEDLIQGVTEYLLQIFRATQATAEELDYSTPLGHLRSMFANIRYWLRDKPEMFVVLAEFTLRSLHDPSLQVPLRQLDASWRTYLQEVIADGIQQGMFRADLDPEGVAKEIVVLLKGVTFHWLMLHEEANLESILSHIECWLLR